MTTRPFTARYAGGCACCDEPFPQGAVVCFDDDSNLILADHLDEPPRPARRPERPACRSCWTVHAGECM